MRSTILVAVLLSAAIVLVTAPAHAWPLFCSRNATTFVVMPNVGNHSFNLQLLIKGKWNRIVTRMQYLPRLRAYIGRVDSDSMDRPKAFKKWSQVTLRTNEREANLQVRDEQTLDTDRPTAEYRDLGCRFIGADSQLRDGWERW